MAFVRTVTHTIPFERVEELQQGADLWLRIVSAQKLIAQESSGMLDFRVWITQNPDGAARVVNVTSWYTLEDMQNFANDPDLRAQEREVRKLAEADPAVDVFEVIG